MPARLSTPESVLDPEKLQSQDLTADIVPEPAKVTANEWVVAFVSVGIKVLLPSIVVASCMAEILVSTGENVLVPSNVVAGIFVETLTATAAPHGLSEAVPEDVILYVKLPDSGPAVTVAQAGKTSQSWP